MRIRYRIPIDVGIVRQRRAPRGPIAAAWLVLALAAPAVLRADHPPAYRGGAGATAPTADRSRELRIVVSLGERRLWAIAGTDTLRSARVATAMGTTFRYAGQSWTFTMPRGTRRVLRKKVDPVWTPPDWHYAEVARRHGLRLRYLAAGRPHRLSDGRVLSVRGAYVGIAGPDFAWTRLPTDEHIVFGSTLFAPPIGTRNRQIEGELGEYALDLGDGYLLHGTPYKRSIGTASTHGCVRLLDEDIEWLYRNVPVGTPVQIRR